MTAIVSMLRGVNVGGNKKIKMDELRALYESLGFRSPQTYIQSGNVVFGTQARDMAKLAKRIEDAIERAFGFHSSVFVRSAAEMRAAIGGNPFAVRANIDPAKLLVTFYATAPNAHECDAVLALNTGPEELRVVGRELFIYYPDGMGRPTLPPSALGKALKLEGTGRNMNTALKLLEMAEAMEVETHFAAAGSGRNTRNTLP